VILMSARDRKLHEYRQRLEAEAAAADGPAADDGEEAAARDQRVAHQAQWVEIQVEQAIRRGDFDDLPGAGKPIPGLDAPHDPDWWLKRLIERERISVLPPALALRTEDAGMDEALDREPNADAVRRVVEDFNARIIDARRQLQGGPPVITPLRDPDREIEAWNDRRRAKVARQKAVLEQLRREEARADRPSWWRRLLERVRPHVRRLT
jgi:hypothetical protein